MERFKNYVLWAAVVALVIDILVYSNVIDISQSQEIQALAQRGLEVLVIAGILSNPSIGKGFSDKDGEQ
jgi:uncharacterized membrane protein